MPCCKSVRPLGSVGRFQGSNEAQVIDDYPNRGRQWWSRWSGAANGGLRRPVEAAEGVLTALRGVVPRRTCGYSLG